jgi:hypothetical protein
MLIRKIWQEATAGSINLRYQSIQVEGSEKAMVTVMGRELRSRPVKDQLPILPER